MTETITLYGNPKDLFKIKNAILNYNNKIVFDVDEITTIPKEKVKLKNLLKNFKYDKMSTFSK